MATYNLVEAGVAVGRTKSAILKAIKRGAISATRDTVSGGWAIDPAELHRAFPPVSKETLGNHRDTGETGELRELRARFEGEQAKVAMLQDQMTDLRRRLDVEAGERRTVQAQLTALLTDQRPNGPAHPASPRSAWRRFLQWRR